MTFAKLRGQLSGGPCSLQTVNDLAYFETKILN
jgi:hypothetical protein